VLLRIIIGCRDRAIGRWLLKMKMEDEGNERGRG
jgi:hypothetical protein